jgi:tripartite-type tricarboxylate transporter receptor subunit TctC
VPDIPAIAETLPGFESVGFYGISVPKGTPPEIIAILNKEVNAALGDEKFKQRLTDLGATPLPPSSSAEFGKFIADDVAKWAKVIKASGMKPE